MSGSNMEQLGIFLVLLLTSPMALGTSDGNFTCNDGRVIISDWICDAISDCTEGEDEAGCAIDCDKFECVSCAGPDSQKVYKVIVYGHVLVCTYLYQ